MIKASSGNNISKDKLISILKRVQLNSPKIDSNVKYSEHNWHKPRHFSIEQSATLKLFSEKLAEYIQADITNLCHGDFIVSPLSITEHYSYTLERDFYNNEQNYYLNLGHDKTVSQGFVAINKKSALSMVRFILAGEDEPEEEQQNISNLEESLIFDTAETAVVALDKTSQSRGGYSLVSSPELVRGNWPLNLDSLEELCRLDFKIEKKDGSAELSIIIVSKLLEPALKADNSHPKIDKKAIERALSENISKVPVTISAKISTDLLQMQDITGLQPGDLIVLNKKANEPIDIQVNGTDVLHGFPATLGSQLALTITQKEDF